LFVALVRPTLDRGTATGEAMSTHTTSSTEPFQSAQTTETDGRRFVQIIDLYTRHPAELERLLNQWRTSSLAREHIRGVELDRDAADDEHLVLEVEYETGNAVSASSGPSVEAAGVVALLDRPPRFRSAAT
jgi:hypothetical protein